MSSSRREGSDQARVVENLERVTEAALAHLELDELLDELLERICDTFDADTAAILLVDEDGETLTARAAIGLEEEVEQGFRLPIGEGFAGRIAATREPQVIEDLDRSPVELINPLLREKGIHSLLGVPLLVEGRVIGVLHLGTLGERGFDEPDVHLMQAVGDRAALAIAHARLFEAERHARLDAERAAQRVDSLHRITEAALAYLDLDELLNELLTRISAILEADTAAILLVDDDGKTLSTRAAKGLEEKRERPFQLPIGAGFAGLVAVRREPVVIGDFDRSPIEVLNPVFREKGVRSVLGVPLIVEGRLIGVLHVGTLAPREFTEDDIALLRLVGDRAALAIEHNRLFGHYRVAQILQQSLLPRALPEVPGISVAARYLPAETEAAVGGDWYDVFTLRDGKVGLAIGDVVGSGVEAAAFMGQIRNALRVYAGEQLGPGRVMTKLARFVQSLSDGQMATLVYAILDPDASSLIFARAGHPLPLVVSADGHAMYLEGEGGPPLGVEERVVYSEAIAELPPGATLLLYTDGLIERRGERLADTERELLEAVSSAPSDPELLCADVAARMLSEGSAEDDVAVLAVQHVGIGEWFEIEVTARAEQLASVRRFVRRWLAKIPASEHDTAAIALACSEACANAIEHAYGPGDATVAVAGHRQQNLVEIVVRDRGQWRPPRGDSRGRGIGVMESFIDDVEVVPGDAGTTVRLRHRVAGVAA